MSRFLLALLPLLMAACAAPPATDTTVASADEGVHCEVGSRTGSNMISKHCRSAAQREQDKAGVQAVGDQLRVGTPMRDSGR